MKVGNARVCLTPKQEFYLIGYRSDNRYKPATGIHDDIYGNALLLEQDGKCVFLFSADFLEFEETMAEDVKTLLADTYGIDRDMVLLCATHNHSSIVSYHKSWYTGKFDQAYYDDLIATIGECYLQCLNNKQEASVKVGKQDIFGYFGNRNHQGQPADNEVIVVKFYNQANVPFAGLVNWAVHSTSLGADNTMLSSDLAGNISVKLAPMFGFYPAMVVGAAGDCSNRFERKGNDFKELERVSTALAKIIGNIPIEESISLTSITSQTLFHTIHHNMEFVHEEVKGEIEKLKEQVKQGDVDTSVEKRCKELASKLNLHQFHLDTKGIVISLGELQVFVFPGELGSAFGKQLKQTCNKTALILGYTNGYYAYFMPKKEYGLSFETIGSPIPRGEAEKMIQKYIDASKRLASVK